MSSVGQGIGGVVGGVIGFFVGGPTGAIYGAQAGMMVGGLLDPPKVQGPRLEDLTAQTSTYGAFIPRVYGTLAFNGNVFWIQGDRLIERSVEESGKGGPEVTNFEYFASFAVSLCEGPIDGVRRIWVGGQLWYDAGSDDLSTIIASNESAALFTLYTGTDTQDADPLIQADRGVANVPGYRGLAYIVFNELPLKDVGNSIAGAQVKVEVVASGTIGGLTYRGDTHFSSGRGNYTAATYFDDSVVHVWQVDDSWSSGAATSVRRYLLTRIGDPILTQTLQVTLAHTGSVIESVCQGKSDQNVFAIPNKTVGGYGITLVSIFGTVTNIPATVSSNDPTRYYAIKDGIVYFQAGSGALASMNWADINLFSLTGSVNSITLPWALPTGQTVSNVLIVGDELVIAAKKASDSRTYFIRYDLSTLTYVAEIDIATVFGDINIAFQCDSDGIYFYWSSAHILYRRIGMTGSDEIVGSIDAASGGGLEWEPASPSHIYLIFSFGENLTDIWYSFFDGVSSTYRLGTWSKNSVSSNAVTLSTIVESECLKSELLTASDLDVTDLTDQVRGYRISSLGPLRGGIDPLRKAWPFDVVQHGYKIKFKARGGASVATITDAELDAREAGASPGIQVSNVREMDTVIPNQLTVKYLDAVREYDFNVAEETR